MNKVNKLVKYSSIFICVLMLFCCIWTTGCRKRSEQEAVNRINSFFSRYPKLLDQDVKSRVNKAIDNWNNDQIDKSPILFFARISDVKDREYHVLSLVFSDEDANLLGIGIREVKTSNGVETVLEERYPLYIQRSQPAFWSALLKISERDGHVKDETAWSYYMRSEGGYSIFEEKHPTIWISFPRENVRTEVFVYDKDGNVSEFVPVSMNN